jgi:glyoxylase-like metal-dependent hydrolase (beta-lactamase superfamily II)
MKITTQFVPAAVLLFTSALVRAQGINFPKTEILTRQLAPDFYILTGSPGVDPGHPEGAGGRIGVLVGPEGVFMVDATYAPLSDKVAATIRKLSSGAPIRFLVDTHSHPDHTGGNSNFAKQGALVIAREEVWQTLSQPFPPAVAAAIGSAASLTDPARLPILTYGEGAELKVRLNGEVIDVIGLPPAHTNGDTIVKFEKSDVIMIGDFYRNYGYPFIDSAHGGSFAGVIQALDQVMALAGPDTKLVPGHGTVIGRADLPPYRDMIVSVRKTVQQMIRDGRSRWEILAAKLTAPYDAKVPGGQMPLPAGLGTSADRFVSEVFEELGGKQ